MTAPMRSMWSAGNRIDGGGFKRIAKVFGSVNLDFFILVSVDNQRRRSLVFKSLNFGDDYPVTSPDVAWRSVSPDNRFLPASRNSFDQA